MPAIMQRALAPGVQRNTAGAVRERGEWYTSKLRELAEISGRALSLVIRAGCAFVQELRRSFAQVISVDTTPFLKTVNRQQLAWSEGTSPEWIPKPLAQNQPLDDLLDHNVRRYLELLSFQDNVAPAG